MIDKIVLSFAVKYFFYHVLLFPSKTSKLCLFESNETHVVKWYRNSIQKILFRKVHMTMEQKYNSIELCPKAHTAVQGYHMMRLMKLFNLKRI